MALYARDLRLMARRRIPSARSYGTAGVRLPRRGQTMIPFGNALTPEAKQFVQSKGQKVLYPGSRAPSAPRVPGPQPPGQPPQPHQLVDDSTATSARAQALFARTQKLNQLSTEDQYGAQDYAENLSRLRAQRPKDELAAKESANRQGLFYSGALGKDLGNLATSYGQRESDMTLQNERAVAARAAARQAIMQGAPLEDAAISAALADRQIASDSSAADAGALAPNAPPAPGRPAAGAPARRGRAPRQTMIPFGGALTPAARQYVQAHGQKVLRPRRSTRRRAL
jgi:hypothetical protein